MKLILRMERKNLCKNYSHFKKIRKIGECGIAKTKENRFM